MASAIRAVDSGAGVLCLYGNYGGDKMNFQQAIEDCEFDDIRCRSVLACDDVASSPRETAEKRRGVAGILYAYKCAGAAAGQMRSLDEVAAVAEKAVANTRTMGVALTPCIVPEAGRPTFAIADDEIEIGMGIHGEKGITVEKMMTADRSPRSSWKSCSRTCRWRRGRGLRPGERAGRDARGGAVHRSTPGGADSGGRGVKIFMPHVGEFATSMEMAGLSVTLFKLDGSSRSCSARPLPPPFTPMPTNDGGRYDDERPLQGDRRDLRADR
ncbi:MAG: dihydroxyacetone kinase subunit DhaK [Anaerotruncus massiliensis (ex Togo et al. 2019)]